MCMCAKIFPAELTTYLQLVSLLRIYGALPQFLYIPFVACTKRKGFTFVTYREPLGLIYSKSVRRSSSVHALLYFGEGQRDSTFHNEDAVMPVPVS